MAKLQFKDIIDIHAGKTALVVANGPSTKPLLKHIASCSKQKDKYVIFVCNEIDEMLENVNLKIGVDIIPDYWVIASTTLTVGSRFNNFNKLTNGALLFADSADMTRNPEELLNIDFLPYDQRHFDNKPCPIPPELGCCEKCKDVIPHRITIQEELKNYCGANSHYGTASTVALHMLAFSILMGCKKSYISGVDLDYSLGYFDRKTTNPDGFKLWISDILSDFKTINESAKLKGVEVINLSPFSPLKDIFKTNV